MPTTPAGHQPDQSFPKVAINQQLWAQINSLIPQSWYEWGRYCMGLRAHYGLPVKLPHQLGIVQTASGPVKVILADGDRLMTRHDMDFNQGGNGYEDPRMCPRDVILVDSQILFPDVDGVAPIVYHEISEGPGDGDGRCMAKGWSYDKAHVVANAKERIFRQRMLTG